LGAWRRGDCGLTEFNIDVELDVRQLACPMPILRGKKSLAKMLSGQILRITATDKKSPADFADFCRQTGNELLASEINGNEYIFLIRRR
jgi:tRNA 2-thiouridine synthesizing protein A